MPELQFKEVKIIDVDDWDNLVTEVYGKPYSFQQQDGCKSRGIEYFDIPGDFSWWDDFENDSIPEEVNGDKMGVSFKAWLERDPKKPLVDDEDGEDSWTIELFWHRNFYPCVGMIIQDLYNRGILQDGSYGINIDW